MRRDFDNSLPNVTALLTGIFLSLVTLAFPLPVLLEAIFIVAIPAVTLWVQAQVAYIRRKKRVQEKYHAMMIILWRLDAARSSPYPVVPGYLERLERLAADAEMAYLIEIRGDSPQSSIQHW